MVQTHFDPTPPVVPAVTLDVNPPGPADDQEKLNASPPVLLVTLFSGSSRITVGPFSGSSQKTVMTQASETASAFPQRVEFPDVQEGLNQ